MFRDALAAVDGTPSSFQAAAYAAILSRAKGGSVTLLSVVDPVRDASKLRDPTPQKQADLRSATATIGDLGLVRAAEIAEGRPAQVILDRCHGGDADLICLGAGRKPRTLGSTSSEVVRHARCPVLVVREGPSVGLQIERILVAFDGSESALRAVDVAGRLAGDVSGACFLLWILEGPWPLPRRGVDLSREEVQALAGPPEQEEMTRAKERIEEAGGEVSRATFEIGDAADRILARAEDWNVDLIVLGARSRNPTGRLLRRGVSDRVVARADRPVLVVH